MGAAMQAECSQNDLSAAAPAANWADVKHVLGGHKAKKSTEKEAEEVRIYSAAHCDPSITSKGGGAGDEVVFQ